MINVFNPPKPSNYVEKQGDFMWGRLVINDALTPPGEFAGITPIRQDLEVIPAQDSRPDRDRITTEVFVANPFMRWDSFLPSEGPRRKQPIEVVETDEQKKQREYFETKIKPRLIVQESNKKLVDLFRELIYKDMAENLLIRGGVFRNG